MSTSNVTPDPMAVGLATGPAPTPAAPSAIQPNDAQPEQRAPQSGAQPNQPAANSNTPDADTAAAKSMPAALANNPQVPSQKIASTIDDNKNSDSPAHSALYKAAIEMTGGQRYTSTTDADGNIVRTPIQPKPWALGLALALNVLSGGMAGLAAKGPGRMGDAAQLGAAQADKQRAAVQNANAQQDQQAKADQSHKMAVTEANMRNYMTSVNAGKSSMAASQAFGDSYKDWAGFSDGTIPLPTGMSKSEPQWETDVTAAVKDGKTNVTHDFLFPIGDPKPVIGKDGQQVIVNGIPQVGHDFVTLHGIGPNSTMVLTKAMQKSFIDAGIMSDTKAGIGEPQWPMSDIAKKSAMLASINTGEQMLEDHKNDTVQLLGHAGTGGKDGKGVQDLDDLKAAIKSDPRLSKALGVFSQAQMGTSGANGHLEDILNTMGQRDPASRGILMNHLGLSEADLDAMHNKRASEAAAATAEGKNAFNPDKQLVDPKLVAAFPKTVKTNYSTLTDGQVKTLTQDLGPNPNQADMVKIDARANTMEQNHIAAQQKQDTSDDKNVTALWNYGKNPATGDDLNLTNAPQGMLVDTSNGNPIPYKMVSTMKPSMQETNRADFARSAVHSLDELDKLKGEHKLPNGPLTGYTTQKLIDAGMSSATAQESANFISLAQSATTGAHVGGRFQQSIMDKMSQMLRLGMNDAQFQGAENSIRNVMQQYVDHGGRVTVADWKNMSTDDKARMSGTGPAGNSNGASGPKVSPEGTIITVKGQQQIKQAGKWIPYQGGK